MNGHMSFDETPQSIFLVERTPTMREGTYIKSCRDFSTKLHLFAVPYLCRNESRDGFVYFGLLDSSNLSTLFSFSDQLVPQQHDDKIRALQTEEIKLRRLDLDDHPEGVRFCTVPKKEFDTLLEFRHAAELCEEPKVSKTTDSQTLTPIFLPPASGTSDRGCFVVKEYTGGNEMLPAKSVMVSRWTSWPYEGNDIDCSTSELFVSAYRNGFGSRDSTKVLGLNVYMGTRQGEIATPDLTRGPGEAGQHQYHRQEYADILLPPCEVLMAHLVRQAKCLARSLDPIIYRLLLMKQYDDPLLGICRRKILTMGLLKKCLGFANTPHTDHFDYYSKAMQRELVDCYASYLTCSHRRNKLCAEYLQRWVEQYDGFCCPTTCGYLFSGRLNGDQSKIEIIQYFLMEGLGFAVKFSDATVHHYYGNQFAHNTAVCVAIGSGGLVSYKSDPSSSDSFRIFAWGGN
jgi:hypothetical protein